MERLASMSDRTNKSIGVIGLGIIGRAIAAHLRRKGFSVFVWNRSPQPVPNFVGSLGELAGICDYIQIFVSDDEALLQTVEQLSESLMPRHLVLAHSTVAPDSMRAASEIVERRGARFVEASFTGSKPAAEKGELVYYVGAADAALRAARSILEASSKEIIHIGEIGQASAIKIATNMITAARDQLSEQMQWGHGDNDYSVVARKYLQEGGSTSHEEPPPEHPDQESIANEPIIASPESHTEQLKPEDTAVPSSQQPLLAFTG